MPYPFSKGVFIYGDPIYVKADASDAEMEAFRVKLEDTLNEITGRADAYFD